jgi:hypothetical protein
MPQPLLLRLLAANPALATLRDAATEIALPDAWLVAGALTQTVWNALHNFSPTHGIHDIDLIYHDPADLSATAEAAHEARLRRRFSDLGLTLDVKNQARVHLWYERRFGRAIPPHPSSAAAIATFPTTATAIGLRLASPAIHAPFGLADLFGLTVRANPRIAGRAVYDAKAARWKTLWPRLTVLPWAD